MPLVTTLYLSEQGCEDPSFFLEAKRDPRAQMFGKRSSRRNYVRFLFVGLQEERNS